MYDVQHRGNQIEVNARSAAASYLSVVGIVIVIFFVGILTRPTDYADIDNYSIYLSQLVHNPPENWYYFEVFSNIYLLILYHLFGNVDAAIVAAHYVLGAMFVIMLWISAPPQRTPWQSLIFMFAFLGALLAFVTLRATPTYFLVTIAVGRAARRDVKAWVYLALAACFHAAALLAAPPLAILYFRSALPRLLRIDRPAWVFLLAIVFLGGVRAAAPALSESAISVFGSVPVLSKYLTYAEAVNSANQATSFGHYIFFASVTLFTLVFLAKITEENKVLVEYTLISYVIYTALFLSVAPVVSVRQTPFWLMPMILRYPWYRIGIRGITAPVFLAGCAGLFYFQFTQVYLWP